MDINIDELKRICIDFFKLAGMEFSLWDENKRNIFSYPDAHSPFCKAVRNDKNLYYKCLRCDIEGLEEVDKTKQPYIYQCHMGLTEAIVPIMQDDEIVGYLMLGQMAEDQNRNNILNITKKVASSKETEQKLILSLDETTSCSHDKIIYCINTLKIMINYMNLSYVIQKTNESVFYKANKHINNNISEPILPMDICKHIGVSSNTLYRAIIKNTGISPTRYIKKVKTDEAKRLLINSNIPISEVAEKVGIPDVNYFIRVFKKETSQSPLRFRKNNSD